tara:strand:+ start:318 stop:527 length:210 start_codon:yes stop_codon:yes gene_type:complete
MILGKESISLIVVSLYLVGSFFRRLTYQSFISNALRYTVLQSVGNLLLGAALHDYALQHVATTLNQAFL